MPFLIVRFRVATMYPNLKPYSGHLNIEIFDAKDTLIQQWMGVDSIDGVFGTNFLINADPELGQWKIKVTVKGRVTEKHITVKRYVLPKFNVIVNAGKNYILNSGPLTANINASYTFGKVVHGTAVVQFIQYPDNRVLKQYHVDIHGTGAASLPANEVPSSTKEIVIVAQLGETTTGTTVIGSTTVNVLKAIKMSFGPTRKAFSPGLPYVTFVAIKRCRVHFPYDYKHTTVQTIHKSIPVGADGTPKLTFTTPVTSTKINIKVTLKGVTESLTIHADHTKSMKHIQINTNEPSAKVGLTYTMDVKLSHQLDGFIQNVALQIPVMPEFAPKAHILVFAVYGNEIVADEIDIDVEGNPSIQEINLNFEKETVRPGEKVKLNVAGLPKSKVHLLAVDESIHILQSGYDLSVAEVLQKLQQFDSIPSGHSGNVITKREANSERRLLKRSIDGDINDADDLFRTTGVNIISDASVFDFDAVMAKKLAGMKTYCKENKPVVSISRHSRKFGKFGPTSGRGTKTVFSNIPPARVIPDAPEPKPLPPTVAKVFPVIPALPHAHTRKHFPETWIWETLELNNNGMRILEKTIPDTVTSWRASAFSLSGTFGITASVAKITAFMKLFVDLTLPFKVVKNEKVAVKVSVFNYQQKSVMNQLGCGNCQDKLQIFKHLHKTFIFFTRITFVHKIFFKLSCFNNHYITVVALSTKIKNDFLPLENKLFTSINNSYFTTEHRLLNTGRFVLGKGHRNQARDIILLLLRVTHTADPQKIEAHSVQLGPGATALKYFQLDAKESGVSNVTVSVIDFLTFTTVDSVQKSMNIKNEGIESGYNKQHLIYVTKGTTFTETFSDVNAPTMANLGNLLRRPTGCGEQTIINLAPNIFATRYLKVTNQLTESFKKKAIEHMIYGRDNELRWQRSDGSFSAWGNRDSSGSMITAYVAMSFQQAKDIIHIDKSILTRAVDWIIRRQYTTGYFPEPGRVIHVSMQGGATSSRATYTAFVLIALLEIDDIPEYKNKITTAANKAKQYIESQISTITDNYSLSLCAYALKLTKSTKANILFQKLENNAINKDNKMKCWDSNLKKTTQGKWVSPNPRARPIDIETAAYALLYYSLDKDITNGLKVLRWLITQRNPNGGFASTQFPDSTNTVNIRATGSGVALVDVVVVYNIKQSGEHAAYNITTGIKKESFDSITVEICARRIKSGDSGMVVEEITLPSGFKADLTSIQNVQGLKQKEADLDKVALYFDRVGNTNVCVDMKADRVDKVIRSESYPVEIYDYYDPQNQGIGSYTSGVLKNLKLCDVCPTCYVCIFDPSSRMELLLLVLGILSLWTPAVDGSTYLVSAPNLIRPGMTYGLSVSILKSTSAVNVKVTLILKPTNKVIVSTSGSLKQGETKVLSLDIPTDIANGPYALTVEGSGGLTFNRQRDIAFRGNDVLVLIQTDKAIYSEDQRGIYTMCNVNF
ncbi:hypothetical protein KUTeg_003610 [Tegillarca granosa]|uniref:CD109 n=1 Tax=Tegillarca granosa TaxID=220873 RepID=A0ABQ9FML7_TEGGR|nr:hypothetical protein KUTeg_003610 [Tegillarca granosa]